MNMKNLEDLLLKEGLIDEKELEKAREEMEKSHESLEKTLISMAYITEQELAYVIAKETGINFIDLENREIDPEILRFIPAHIARKHKFIPVEQKDNTLVLAMTDPFDIIAIDDVRLITGYHIEPAIATEESIMREINRRSQEHLNKKYTEPVEIPFYKKEKITEGTIFAKNIENASLPLKYTEVRAIITGMIADVKVTQKFHNDLTENIEAVYMFPLPHESAVHDFEIIIDKRVIKSEIKEREEAKRTYEKAKREMKKAGLLEQERPNIFTVSVANIEPAQEILVNLRYSETLKYEEGVYEFVFPMTVTPGYGGKDGAGIPESLEGKSSPPIIHPSKNAGREVKIFIDLHTGFETGNIFSPAHKLFIEEKNRDERHIEFSHEEEIPNKDFVLKYSSKGEKMESSFTFYREEGHTGTFMCHITPKIHYGPEEMLKREIIFVLDRSGSMSNEPMEHAKKALKDCLKNLRDGDTFSIIAFDNTVESLSDKILPFNEENLLLAETFLNGIYSRGGTEILMALKHALNIPLNKEYLRQIVFLTDGAVWDEDSSLKEILRDLGNSRIFTFGIGPSVNRYFLSKIAGLGRGTCHFITVPEEIEEAIETFSLQTSCPILSDLSLEWEDCHISDIYPYPVPDIYFGEVLYLTGRFHSSGKAKAILSGIKGTGMFREEFFVELPQKDEKYPVIETIWARRSVEVLMDKIREEPVRKAEIRDEIIGIALKHKLMTAYTSLVAVEQYIEEEREKKEIIKVDVPQILPEGLNYDAFTEPSGTSYDWSSSTDLCEVSETVQDMACYDFGSFEETPDEEKFDLDQLKELVDEAPIVRVVNLIISQAINDGASDIHIENREKNLSVRYRIDGVLHEVMSPPKHIEAALMARIKIMANLDIAERRIAQYGKIHLKHDGKDYKLHVSTLPAVKGEKIVIKILDNNLPEISQMGFSPDMEILFKKLLYSSSGLIIVTGPSDTGKTTTLYNALKILNNEHKNIITLEDEVKYHIDGINQVEANYKIGLFPEHIIRYFDRHDSDIIMVKDLHGSGTANMAVRAAISGQLVLSNLYTDYSSEVPLRLVHMGIEPFLVASVLKGAVAQRLVRKICNNCRVSYSPAEEILKKFGIDDGVLLYRGTGCDHCKGTGYKGRTGVYEIMTVDEEISSLILKGASHKEIREVSVQHGMITLDKDFLGKVLDGITTVEEYFMVKR